MKFEFIISMGVQLLSAGIFIGGLIASVRGIEKQITRLETKQEKHNNLIERMVKVEESTKSAHHRIDEIR